MSSVPGSSGEFESAEVKEVQTVQMPLDKRLADRKQEIEIKTTNNNCDKKYICRYFMPKT